MPRKHSFHDVKKKRIELPGPPMDVWRCTGTFPALHVFRARFKVKDVASAAAAVKAPLDRVARRLCVRYELLCSRVEGTSFYIGVRAGGYGMEHKGPGQEETFVRDCIAAWAKLVEPGMVCTLTREAASAGLARALWIGTIERQLECSGWFRAKGVYVAGKLPSRPGPHDRVAVKIRQVHVTSESVAEIEFRVSFVRLEAIDRARLPACAMRLNPVLVYAAPRLSPSRLVEIADTSDQVDAEFRLGQGPRPFDMRLRAFWKDKHGIELPRNFARAQVFFPFSQNRFTYPLCCLFTSDLIHLRRTHTHERERKDAAAVVLKVIQKHRLQGAQLLNDCSSSRPGTRTAQSTPASKAVELPNSIEPTKRFSPQTPHKSHFTAPKHKTNSAKHKKGMGSTPNSSRMLW